MRRLLSCVLLWAVPALVLSGCFDPPRSNPLDPRSDAFENVGAVGGHVIDQAGRDLDSVEVELVSLTEDGARPVWTTRTDPTGRFTFEAVPAGRYRMELAAPRTVRSRADTVEVQAGELLELPPLALNLPPRVQAFRLWTEHVSRWWPEPQNVYALGASVEVDDPDVRPGIEGVWLETQAGTVIDTLEPSAVQPGRYVARVAEARLPGGRLADLLGSDLVVYARDREGVTTTAAPRHLVRIVEETPVAEAPRSLATVDEAHPRLQWQALRLPFTFTYRVDVYREEAEVAQLAYTHTDISSDSTSVVVEEALAPGPYSWAVSVVDAHGNRSRSKRAGFQVE